MDYCMHAYGAKNSDRQIEKKFANTYWEPIRQIFPQYGISQFRG